MNLESLRSALHIVEGLSAAGTLNQTLRLFRDRRLLIGEDPLAWGPAPATDDLDRWRTTRERFLDAVYRASDGGEFSFDGHADVGLLMNAARLRDEDDVIVWTSYGLADQLHLAWTVFLFDRMQADPSKLRVIQCERRGPSDYIRTVGELNPEWIAHHCPAPRGLTADDVEELRRAWRVYTSDDPAVLVDYAAGTSPLPLLHGALSALLLRYPDRRSGLGIIDESLLRCVERFGPNAINVVGETMAGNDSPDRPDYTYLLYRLFRMADQKAPPVTLTGRPVFDFTLPLPERMKHDSKTRRDFKVTLTAFGKAVLAGEANTVHENGIDDWIGGVHLTDARSVPFRDGRTAGHPSP